MAFCRRFAPLSSSRITIATHRLLSSMTKKGTAINHKKPYTKPQLELVFFGTSSMMASTTRNVSSLGLSIDGTCWIFDVGEGTQLQMNKAHRIPASNVRRIFITHLHGDHVFGLPGLLLKIGNTINKKNVDANHPIEVYGPPGLREFIRINFSYTSSRMVASTYVVHELWDSFDKTLIPVPDEKSLGQMEVLGSNIAKTAHEDPVTFGPDGYWSIKSSSSTSSNPDDKGSRTSNFEVRAAKLKHTVYSIGYVVIEHQHKDDKGHIRLSKDLVKRLQSVENKEFLAAKGIKNPMSILSRLQEGAESVELADGLLLQSEVMESPKRSGRKITILGDTCDSRNIAGLAFGSDVIVHECTNAFIPSIDGKTTTREGVEARTYVHGHSTPKTAGEFAAATCCSKLVLTHFSRRYKDDHSEEADACMEEIVNETREYCGKDICISCAHDLEQITVPTTSSENALIDDDVIELKLKSAYSTQKASTDATKAAALNYFKKNGVTNEDFMRFQNIDKL